jgi:sugar transferase EpsL
MERLVRELRTEGLDASVLAEFVPSRWRELMNKGRRGRTWARLKSFVSYPVKTLADATFGDTETLIPTTNPFVLPPVLVLSRALHGRMVVPLIYDLYPDAMEVAGVVSSRGLMAQIAVLLNRLMVRHADGVVFIGQRMADHVIARYGEPKHYTVIETGADTQEFEPQHLGPKESQSELEVFCETHFTVSYVGAMGAMHDWETLASAIPRVLETQPTAAFVIAATGPGLARLRESLAGLDSERLRFIEPLSDNAWARLLVRSDVSLVSLRAEARHTSCPSKTFSAMAASSAVLAIAPSNSDLGDVLVQSQGGMLVQNGDSEGVVGAIATWIAEPKSHQLTRERARLAAKSRWDMGALAERWIDFLGDTRKARSARRRPTLSKRAMDVAFSGAGLMVLWPALGGLWIAVRSTMGGPAFFRQKRPGLNGEIFELMKFRTMRDPRPGEEGPEYDAQRITRLGQFMRSTSLDELPTLLNVFKGDMSLVGPRPLLVRYLERYSPEQSRRHHVLPGLTGWAQINGRNATSWEERFKHDLAYVDNRTFWRDVSTLFRTVRKVLVREGISQEGHATMPEFMGGEPVEPECGEAVVIPLKKGG